MTNTQFILSLCNLLVDVLKSNKEDLQEDFIKQLFLKFCALFKPEEVTVYVADWAAAQKEADLAELQKFGT